MKEVQLENGKSVRVSTDPSMEFAATSSHIYADYRNLPKVVQPGSRIYIDDGLISLIVESCEETAVICTIENGGALGTRKGVNLPGTIVDLPAVTSKDIEDLLFGVEQGVDIIFASFIRNADGIHKIRQVLGEK